MTLPTVTFKFLGLIGLRAIIVGIGATVFFFGGFFDVGADHPDPDIVNWALIQVRKASIARHATDRPPASLEDPGLVRAGARAFFQEGCIDCHGGPGVKPAKFSEGLNPPPNLDRVINDLQPQEVFWIIKNGIKMTGMPSFGVDKAPVTNRTIWTIVAFVKKLPSVSDEDFKAWSAVPPGGN
jgi:mono/diheme cytochrome c family protein